MKREMIVARARDAMDNLLPDSGASEDYKRGIVVGLVSGLMACGMAFPEALDYAWNSRRSARMADAEFAKFLPECWRADVLGSEAGFAKM